MNIITTELIHVHYLFLAVFIKKFKAEHQFYNPWDTGSVTCRKINTL